MTVKRLDEIHPVMRSVSTPRSIAYCQLGSFHYDFDSSYPLASEIGSLGLVPTDLRADDDSIDRWCRSATIGDVGLLFNIELSLPINSEEHTLARIRPIIQEAVNRGASLLITSRAPSSDLPSLAGSSLIIDAQKISMRPLSLSQRVEWLRRYTAVPESARERIAFFSHGSRSLLRKFSEVELLGSSYSGNQKITLARSYEMNLAQACLEELRPGVQGWLDYWVYDCNKYVFGRAEAEASPVLEILRNAGLVQMDAAGELCLFDFKSRETWVQSLRKVINSTVFPTPAWRELICHFYEFERDLRWMLARRYEVEYGSEWPTTVLDEYRAMILELARLDGNGWASAIGQLRLPLEWFTLAQLFDLSIEESRRGGPFLGCNDRQWRRIADELRPIRNRLAHMRPPRTGDRDTVIRNLDFLKLRRSAGL